MLVRLGTMINFNKNTGFEELEKKFALLREYGMDNCQLCSWDPDAWTDECAAKVVELSGKYGIEISSFWCGWLGPRSWNFYEGQYDLGLVAPEYRAMRIKNLCDGADFAKKLGVVDVVTHMGFIPENPLDSNFIPMCIAIRTVAEHLKENGQFLLFETGQETPVTMLRCFEAVGCDNLGVNLDTANLILYGKANPVDALDVFGKYVRAMHAKDGFYPTNGHDLGRQVRVGQGKVDFRGVLSGLHDLGYDRCITIEHEIDGDDSNEAIVEAKKYLENIISEVWGGDNNA